MIRLPLKILTCTIDLNDDLNFTGNMHNRIIILFMIAFCCMPSANAQTSHQTDGLAADSSAKKIFSGVVLLADSGKVWFEKATGYRDFSSREPLLATDIFELASVSKQFTAMIIMQLKEKGRLDFDDPVSQYIRIPYQDITIRHLLTHTSGLPDYQSLMDTHWDKSKVAGNDDIIHYLNKYAPLTHFPPGEKYEYSNTGYVLLASIAEKAAGKDFTQQCRDNIFIPLGMKDTDIRTQEEKRGLGNLALGHIYQIQRGNYQHADSFPQSNYTVWLGKREGPGRISSTARDLLKWDQALYASALVSDTILAQAFQPMRLNDGRLSPYGFGWDLSVDKILGRIVGHNGDNPGYWTQIIRCIDTRQTIIVFCNNAFESFEALVKQVSLTVAYALGSNKNR